MCFFLKHKLIFDSFKVTLALHIKFTPTYPEEVPEISIETIDGSIEIDEHEKFYSELMNVVTSPLKIYLYIKIFYLFIYISVFDF